MADFLYGFDFGNHPDTIEEGHVIMKVVIYPRCVGVFFQKTESGPFYRKEIRDLEVLETYIKHHAGEFFELKKVGECSKIWERDVREVIRRYGYAITKKFDHWNVRRKPNIINNQLVAA